MIAALALVALSTPVEPASTLELPAYEPLTAPAPLLGGGGPFSWTFVEANYLWQDVDAIDDSVDGWELRASLEIFFNIFLQGTYSQLSGDADLDTGTLGAGIHFPIGETFDVFGILSWATAEVDGSGFDSDEDGLMGEIGGRFRLGERIELNGEVIWADIDESDTGFDIGARFYILDPLSVGANMTVFDEDESFALGARWQF